MRALFIAFEGLNPASGISKKILAECEGLRSNEVNVDLCRFKENEDGLYAIINDKSVFSFGKGKLGYLKSRLVFGYIIDYVKKSAIDLVYIRYTYISTPKFIHFLKCIKALGVKVFLEVPTYPYDAEFDGCKFHMKVLHAIEKASRRNFKQCVDRIVTVQDYDTIFNIKTVKITNGVAIDNNPLRNPKQHNNIVLLGVASLGPWHGYDRIIEGLGRYYNEGGKKDIDFFVVGGYTSIIEDYKKIASKYGIEERIHFEGKKEKDELNIYFDKADMAISSLGCHRIGLVCASPIKSAEYAARGIPFMYSHNDPIFDACPFVLKVSPDESPINIKALLQFIENISIDKEIIRDYAEKTCTWSIQMKKVCDAYSDLC